MNDPAISDIVTAAAKYAARGWVVHRLTSPKAKGGSPGKRPVDTGWQTVTKPPTTQKLTAWFGNNNPKGYNIGLLCGEASGVTVIDLDRMIYAGIFDGINTLRSARTTGRCHVYFKYNQRLPASKHHNLGIEVLATGNNAVMPPSTHASGDVYAWVDPEAPLATMPEEIELKLTNLFEREKGLNALVKKCRPCFKRLFEKKVREATDFHGAEGRELMVAWGADLKAAGATIADAEMWSKIIYGDDNDHAKTVREWRNIDSSKTWKCETVAAKLGGVIECDCAGCKWKATVTSEAATSRDDDRLVFRTEHLRNYQALDNLIALEGKDFTPFVKAVWYNVLGTLKAQPVRFGNITTDTRFNLFIPMPSGTGKNNLKQAINKIVTGGGKEVRSPTSFHPEQLIGKMLTEKWHNPDKEGKGLNDTRYIPNYGYLHNDSLIFDEAFHFVTRDDKQYEESKTYIRIALDPIGNNLIQKKLIDQLDVPEQRLAYYPRCSITMFLQPDVMDDENVKTGFLRRFNILYIPLVGKNLDRNEEIIRYIKHPRSEVSLDYWQGITEWDAPTYFTFEDGIDDLLIVLHDDLITYMRSLGEKQRNYLDRKAYPIFDDLVGMSTIQAISRKSDTVTQQDVKLAYMDLFEFFKLSLDFVNAKIFGNLDYGEQWHGAEVKEIEALKWLAGSGATDKDKSEVTIADFKAKIAEIFEIEDESARRHYSKLKKRGLIDSRRVGKDSSRVWVTFDHGNASEVAQVNLADTMYWKIAQEGYHPAHLHTCTTLETDSGSDALQVCNAPTDSDSAKSTKPIAGDAKSEGADLQVCNAQIDGRSDDLQVCNPEPTASEQVCNADLRKNDSERTSDTSVQVCTGLSVKNPIELARDERMIAIDRFFRNRGITYANHEELMKFVPEIADQLHINQDVAFRSVMQYGKDRGWLS